MYIIDTKSEEVYKEFPYIKSWVESICDSIIKKEMGDCKIDMFYYYGFWPSSFSWNHRY